MTVTDMTSTHTFATAITAAREAKRAQREEARSDLAKMSQAMIDEKGLINHAQAAVLFGVSVKRVGELVRLGKLRRFDFLGRTYVSVREVQERYEQEIKAGRPKRGVLQRVVGSMRAAAKTDPVQARLGGFAGPYERAKRKKGKK